MSSSSAFKELRYTIKTASLVLEETKEDLAICFDLQKKLKKRLEEKKLSTVQSSKEDIKPAENIIIEEKKIENFEKSVQTEVESTEVEEKDEEKAPFSEVTPTVTVKELKRSIEHEDSSLLLESSRCTKKLETSFITFHKRLASLKVLNAEESTKQTNALKFSEYETKLSENRKKLNKLLEKTKFQPISLNAVFFMIPMKAEKRRCFGSASKPKKYEFLLTEKYLIFGKERIDITNYQVKALKSLQSPTGFEIRLFPWNSEHIVRLAPTTLEMTIEWSKAINNNIKCQEQEEEQGEEKEEEEVHAYFDDIDISQRTKEFNEEKNYYDLLGIRVTDDLKAMKQSYRELAMKYHPDKSTSTEDIDYEEFSKVSKAYQVLKDKELRKQYNLYLDLRTSLRLGIIVKIDGKLQVLFSDEKFKYLIFQEKQYGSVLQKGKYNVVELRYVTKLLAGDNIEFEDIKINKYRVFLVSGKRKGYKDFLIELNSKQNRDDLLDGLRYVRAEASMLFKQNLEKMKEEGYR